MITQVLCLALTLYMIVLIVRIISSWIPRPPEPVLPLIRGAHALTEPLLGPLRGILPPVGGSGIAIDFSPIILWVGIIILQGLFC